MKRDSFGPDRQDYESISGSKSLICVSDLLEGELEISESRLKLIMKIVDDNDLLMEVYLFNDMLPGESLKDHVQRQLAAGTCKGPYDDSLIFLSTRFLRNGQMPDFEAGKKALTSWWTGGGGQGFFRYWQSRMDTTSQTPVHQGQEWLAFLKNVLADNKELFSFPGIIWGTPNGAESEAWNIVNIPIVVVSEEKRSWGMIRQVWPYEEEESKVWGLRNLQMTKNSPVIITSVSVDDERILYQNTASMALFGKRGSMNAVTASQRLDKASVDRLFREAAEPSVDHNNASVRPHYSSYESWSKHPGQIAEGRYHQIKTNEADSTEQAVNSPGPLSSTALEIGEGSQEEEGLSFLEEEGLSFLEEEGLSFLELLFVGNETELQRLKATIVTGLFCTRIEIRSHRLRKWMLLDPSTESFYDLQIASTVEPVTFRRIYIISQTDVTEVRWPCGSVHAHSLNHVIITTGCFSSEEGARGEC